MLKTFGKSYKPTDRTVTMNKTKQISPENFEISIISIAIL
jgi:hypothetical protein